MSVTQEPVYVKTPIPRRVFPVGWLLLLAAALVLPLIAPADDTAYPVQVLIWAVLAGFLGGIVLLTLWSVNRYGRIVVTRDELRVGRHTLNVADIDRPHLLHVVKDTPKLWQRLETSAGQIDWSAAGIRTTGKARLLGGGYATPLGFDSITLALRDDRAVLIPTTDRAGLLEALLQVVPETR